MTRDGEARRRRAGRGREGDRPQPAVRRQTRIDARVERTLTTDAAGPLLDVRPTAARGCWSSTSTTRAYRAEEAAEVQLLQRAARRGDARRGARLRNGSVMTLHADVDGAGRGARGKGALVQAIVGGRWTTVEELTLNDAGGATWRYRFRGTTRSAVYRFRVRVPTRGRRLAVADDRLARYSGFACGADGPGPRAQPPARRADPRARVLEAAAQTTIRGVRSRLAAALRRAGRQFDDLDLDAFYNQAWHGLYLRLAAGRGDREPRRLPRPRRLLPRDRRDPALRSRRACDPAARRGARRRAGHRRACSTTTRKLTHFMEGMRERLTERERKAATLCYIQGYTRPQTAEVLGVSPKRMEKLMDGVSQKIGVLVEDIRGGGWCESRSSLMKAYAFGVLDPDGERWELAVAHLRECPGCRRYVRGLRGIGGGRAADRDPARGDGARSAAASARRRRRRVGGRRRLRGRRRVRRGRGRLVGRSRRRGLDSRGGGGLRRHRRDGDRRHRGGRRRGRGRRRRSRSRAGRRQDGRPPPPPPPVVSDRRQHAGSRTGDDEAEGGARRRPRSKKAQEEGPRRRPQQGEAGRPTTTAHDAAAARRPRRVPATQTHAAAPPSRPRRGGPRRRPATPARSSASRSRKFAGGESVPRHDKGVASETESWSPSATSNTPDVVEAAAGRAVGRPPLHAARRLARGDDRELPLADG